MKLFTRATSISATLFRSLTLFAAACLAIGGAPAEAQNSEQFDAALKTMKALGKSGPHRAKLGDIAEINVPKGYIFIPRENLKKFNDFYRNATASSELGALQHESLSHFMMFEWSEDGYVKDDEKIDADGLLASMKEMSREGNKMRKSEGLPELELVGWEKAPFYDPKTNNLSWATRLKSSDGISINYYTKLLGRRGIMSAILVVDPTDLQSTLPKFESTIAGYSFVTGQKYSEWKAGDKVAAYGLGALVGGGALAVAAKSGFLGKMLKPLIIFGAAAFAGIAGFFKKLFGGGARA